jgi:hypothetical protein
MIAHVHHPGSIDSRSALLIGQLVSRSGSMVGSIVAISPERIHMASTFNINTFNINEQARVVGSDSDLRGAQGKIGTITDVSAGRNNDLEPLYTLNVEGAEYLAYGDELEPVQ